MLMYQWVLIPLDSLLNVRLSQQWWKTRLEPKRMRDWVFDMNERKWAGILKYNVLFRALVPEIWFGKGVPNQFQGFKLFRNVEPELVFCKGKNGNLGGEKEPWGVGWVFFRFISWRAAFSLDGILWSIYYLRFIFVTLHFYSRVLWIY
jgi:hypothetical protein